MILLICKNNDFFININEHIGLTTGRYEIILREMGFKYDPISKVYWLNGLMENRKKVNDMINFFDKKGIPMEISEEINGVKYSFEQEREIFTKSRQLGLQIKKGAYELIQKPPNFIRVLKPYQYLGINHLIAVNNGANFSVPGSGKTTMVYGAYDIWKELNQIDKILVIGPINSFCVWESEYKECFGKEIRSTRLIGNNRFGYYDNYARFELFLTSYQTASNDLVKLIKLLKKSRFLVVIDESHNIKKFENGLWADSMLNLAQFAEKRVICTGTPVPNSLLDLYSQMTFLWPNKQLLGEKNSFFHRYRNSRSINGLRELIHPFYIRVRKSDLDLPSPIEKRYFIEGSPIQMEINKAIEREIQNKYASLSSREILKIQEWKRAKIVRLMQVATNPGLLMHYSEEFKINPIMEGEMFNLIEKVQNYYSLEFPNKFGEVLVLAEEIINRGEKVIIWSNFIQNLLILYNHFKKKDIDRYLIYGRIPRDPNINEEFNREQQIKEFITNPNPTVLIANPAACAESISLHTHCHNAIYLDRSFNCGKYLQSLDRIHRIGLPKNIDTYYHHFITKNTIDEVIDLRLETKKRRMLNLIENDIPIGLNYDSGEWNNIVEFEKDFLEVLKYIKIKSQENK